MQFNRFEVFIATPTTHWLIERFYPSSIVYVAARAPGFGAFRHDGPKVFSLHSNTKFYSSRCVKFSRPCMSLRMTDFLGAVRRRTQRALSSSIQVEGISDTRAFENEMRLRGDGCTVHMIDGLLLPQISLLFA